MAPVNHVGLRPQLAQRRTYVPRPARAGPRHSSMLACRSGGLPIRQNRQLPKARHGAGARPVHFEFFLYLINNYLVSDFVTARASAL